MKTINEYMLLILIVLLNFGPAFNQVFRGINQNYKWIPTDIPDGIVDLRIYSNNILEINDTSFNYSNFSLVKYANLRYNGIRSISRNAFARFTRLVTLNLDSNRLTHFEIVSTYMPDLETVKICCNQLSAVPKFDGVFGNLKTLYLGNNNIRYVYAQDFQNITNLVYLFMQSNNMIAFESFYQKGLSLSKLNEVRLHENTLTLTERNFAGFHGLRTIYLDSSGLTSIELDSNDTPNLQTLYLRSNLLTTTPVFRGTFQSLVSIYLDSCKLINFELISNNTPNLQTLSLVSNSLSVIPNFIGKIQSLVTLQLDNNAIQIIHPNSFVNISNLRQLDLSNNKIKEFTSFAELPNLEEFDLAHNNLMKIPQLNGSYSTPLNLHLEYNNISTESMLKLKTYFNISGNALRNLYLSANPDLGNNIDGVIDYIVKNFPNIGYITLSNLNIQKLPDLKPYDINSISLDLSRNNIAKISPGQWEIISQINTLKLNLDNNPLVLNVPNLLQYVRQSTDLELRLSQAKFNCGEMCWMLETRYVTLEQIFVEIELWF